MKYERMKMPDGTAQLIYMSLDMLEVESFEMDEATIIFDVKYEGGVTLTFMVRTVRQQGLFQKKPAVAIIATSLDEHMVVCKVHLRTFMRQPKHRSDVQFITEIGMHIKSTAWAIAATEGIGECVTFPGRPRTQMES